MKKKRYHQKFLAVCRYEKPSRTCPLREWESHTVIIPLLTTLSVRSGYRASTLPGVFPEQPGIGNQKRSRGAPSVLLLLLLLFAAFIRIRRRIACPSSPYVRPPGAIACPERLPAERLSAIPPGFLDGKRPAFVCYRHVLGSVRGGWGLPFAHAPFPASVRTDIINNVSLFALSFSSTSADDPRARFRGQRAGKRLSVLGKPIFPAG